MNWLPLLLLIHVQEDERAGATFFKEIIPGNTVRIL
jgi:hypothetical protein